jgi:hypothetical protein
LSRSFDIPSTSIKNSSEPSTSLLLDSVCQTQTLCFTMNNRRHFQFAPILHILPLNNIHVRSVCRKDHAVIALYKTMCTAED